jgi:hypothetical protein
MNCLGDLGFDLKKFESLSEKAGRFGCLISKSGGLCLKSWWLSKSRRSSCKKFSLADEVSGEVCQLFEMILDVSGCRRLYRDVSAQS